MNKTTLDLDDEIDKSHEKNQKYCDEKYMKNKDFMKTFWTACGIIALLLGGSVAWAIRIENTTTTLSIQQTTLKSSIDEKLDLILKRVSK